MTLKKAFDVKQLGVQAQWKLSNLVLSVVFLFTLTACKGEKLQSAVPDSEVAAEAQDEQISESTLDTTSEPTP